MKTFTLSFIGIVLTLGVYVWLISPARWMAVVSLAVIYFLIYLGIAGTMGWPKPIDPPDSEVVLVAADIREGVGIFVWVREEISPRAYALPWNMETAKRLRAAQEDAEKTGAPVMMTTGTEGGEWMFYPLPPQESPPKSP